MKKTFLFLISYSLFLASCVPTIDVFEKDVAIPKQQWSSDFKPEISFSITDTVSLYNVYLVIRHTDAYNYNNIWVKATVQQPGDKSTKSEQYDLRLAANDKGWLGSAMDDIYEQRVLIQPQTKFSKAGSYQFTLEQVMREDPLLHVMNVGLRVEKAK
ncbi:MAG: gliding motility lipoprotein GldH [Bacteroidetes bacterium]|nr:gliding motility lipoprotein GldH [Bacteroidota bacterium]